MWRRSDRAACCPHAGICHNASSGDRTRRGVTHLSTAFNIWYGLAGFIAFTWMLRWYVVEHYRRRERMLGPDSYAGHPTPPPRVSVLVAGKDEENYIETCVRSLMTQDYPNYQVIAVNDRSTDATPRILDRLKLEFGDRLHVIHVEHLPGDWFGKHHAMHLGVQAADGAWLLFTDADCRQTSPRTISVAMHEAIKRKVDFLSVIPIMENRKPWESWLQPVCSAVLLLWFQPRKVNKSHKKVAYANGAFMLLRRGCYDAIGGHPAFRNMANEDIHMARRTKELGLRLKVIMNEGLYVTHMYRNFREAWRGWGRIFFGCLVKRWKIALAMGFLLFFSLFPWVSAMAAAAGWALDDAARAPMWRTALLVWMGAIAVKQWALISWYRIIKTPVKYSIGYVIGSVIALGMLIHAFLQAGGRAKTSWRGTSYRAGVRVDAPAPAPVASPPQTIPVETVLPVAAVELAPKDVA
ncbi:MAG: glycosyltransferase [Phycisphaerales bacterium]|nr:glycosyltransferase [Phycisphaerales bacterium]